MWFRRALRSGRGGGGSDVGRRWGSGFAERDACGDAASTLPGANTDSNAIPRPPSPRTLYLVTGGGARTLTKPLTVPVPIAESAGKPAFARSHATRFCRVTPSTIAMSDI